MDNASGQVGGSSNQSSRLVNTDHNRHLKKKNLFKKLVKPLVVLAFLITLTLGIMFLYGSTTSSKIDSSKYQAVFLTNGQVYFGKLKIQNGGYMILTNIYYLQTKTTTDDGDEIQAAEGEDSADVELVKLGQEIHGPTDEMIINADQVLFFENLKTDGKLTQTIVKFESESN